MYYKDTLGSWIQREWFGKQECREENLEDNCQLNG